MAEPGYGVSLLLTVFLVPLAFFDRDYARSETTIAYVEVPKVALLRTLVGLMAVLWLRMGLPLSRWKRHMDSQGHNRRVWQYPTRPQ